MEVKTIAVIGAGAMGRAIAYAALFGGYKTVLEDVSSRLLTQATAWIEQSFDDGVARGTVTAGVRDRALRLLTTCGDVKDAIGDAELIIETAPEELEIKLELFTVFDKFAKNGAIFASNASSLSVADFSDVTVSQERCIGMRFSDPGPIRKRVALLPTPFTSEETISTCREVGRRMGREVVLGNARRNAIGGQ